MAVTGHSRARARSGPQGLTALRSDVSEGDVATKGRKARTYVRTSSPESPKGIRARRRSLRLVCVSLERDTPSSFDYVYERTSSETPKEFPRPLGRRVPKGLPRRPLRGLLGSRPKGSAFWARPLGLRAEGTQKGLRREHPEGAVEAKGRARIGLEQSPIQALSR